MPTPDQDERRHPDLFTRDEAAAYLHLETAETLRWLEEQGWLTGYMVGKVKMYHRRDLDACAFKMFGMQVPAQLARPKELRMAQ